MMHGKLLCVVYLLHNTILLILSLSFATVLMLFWRTNAIFDRRYSVAERSGIVWPNFIAVIIAVANVINGFITYKREQTVGLYVYMSLCIVCACVPLSLVKLIRINEPCHDDDEASEEEATTLITVVNAFACTFFASNFICFYNAFTLQYALRNRKPQNSDSDNDKRTSSSEEDHGRQEEEVKDETKDTIPHADQERREPIETEMF